MFVVEIVALLDPDPDPQHCREQWRPVSVVDEHVLQVLSGEGGLLGRRLEQAGLFSGGARLPLVRTRHH